jgi:LysM repeat protein
MYGSRLWLNVVLVVFVVLLAAAPGAALAAPVASSTASAPASVVAASAAISNDAPSFGAGPACEYRVRWGDTLANIAWRYHTSATYLARLNDLRNRNHIYAGQWLDVPCQGHRR